MSPIAVYVRRVRRPEVAREHRAAVGPGAEPQARRLRDREHVAEGAEHALVLLARRDRGARREEQDRAVGGHVRVQDGDPVPLAGLAGRPEPGLEVGRHRVGPVATRGQPLVEPAREHEGDRWPGGARSRGRRRRRAGTGGAGGVTSGIASTPGGADGRPDGLGRRLDPPDQRPAGTALAEDLRIARPRPSRQSTMTSPATASRSMRTTDVVVGPDEEQRPVAAGVARQHEVDRRPSRPRSTPVA